MQLRSATVNDLAAVRRLLLDCELPPDGLEDQFGPAYAVAKEAGTVLGAAGVERYGEYGLLRSVATAPGWRGRGIGAALVRDRLAWAEAEGLSAVYLLTTSAESFFPRLGFERVDREALPEEIRGSRQFAGVCPDSAIAMRRALAR